MGLEIAMKCRRRCGRPAESCDALTICFEQLGQPTGGIERLVSRHGHSLEKEHQPCLPIAVFTGLVEQIIIEGAVLFEKQAQISIWVTRRGERASSFLPVPIGKLGVGP